MVFSHTCECGGRHGSGGSGEDEAAAGYSLRPDTNDMVAAAMAVTKDDDGGSE